MPEFSGAWSREEVESLLGEATIPIRIACHRPDESLWMVAVWYRYRDGYFECATWAEADVVTYLRNDSEVAFEVSVNEPPYRGVRGNGSVGLSRDEDKGAAGRPARTVPRRHRLGVHVVAALAGARGGPHSGPPTPGVQLRLH